MKFSKHSPISSGFTLIELLYLRRRQEDRRGFTLIELLIVIAVIGVLAAVVLSVINPLEQLAKSRDAGRRSSVGQLGKAMSAYFLSTSTYPSSTTSWQTTNLVGRSEIQKAITVPSTGTVVCSGAPQEGNICYQTLSAGTDIAIWTIGESANTKAVCTAGQTAAITWIASRGQTGIFCMGDATGVPDPAVVLK